MLNEGWDNNPDGGGYAFINKDGNIVSKHTLDRKTFIKSYLKDHKKYGKTSDFVIHVRIATHGSVTVANCHPFDVPTVNGQSVMMHNGIISNMDTAVKDTDLTDTQGLIQHVLVDLDDTWLDNPYIVDYISNFIDYSKLVFLTTNPDLDDTLYIINDDMGVWHEGIWYSNYGLFIYPTANTPAPTTAWYKWAKVGVKNAKAQTEASEYKWQVQDGVTVTYPKGTGVGTGKTYPKKKSGMVNVMKGSEDNDWNNSAFTYFHNGVAVEGTKPDKLGFEDWLIDPKERRASTEELLFATGDEHVELFNESLILGDECGICTGISACLCDDTCATCYEFYHQCECNGDFFSLTDSFRSEWGDRVSAILTSADMDAVKKVKHYTTESEDYAVDGSDLVIPW